MNIENDAVEIGKIMQQFKCRGMKHDADGKLILFFEEQGFYFIDEHGKTKVVAVIADDGKRIDL